jgi:hypothetical protein
MPIFMGFGCANAGDSIITEEITRNARRFIGGSFGSGYHS